MASSMRFQSGIMKRSDLHEADYNPRKISANAKKQLKKSIKAHGLVTPIVYNKRTGNIVGGHQRIDVMDEIHKGKDYEVPVAIIDVDESEEVAINIMLNQDNAQGDWDTDKLIDIRDSFPEINLETDCGFSVSDIEILLGDVKIEQQVKAFDELVGRGNKPEPITRPSVDDTEEEDDEVPEGMTAEEYHQAVLSNRAKTREKVAESIDRGDTYEYGSIDNTVTIIFDTNTEKHDFMKKYASASSIDMKRIKAKDLVI